MPAEPALNTAALMVIVGVPTPVPTVAAVPSVTLPMVSPLNNVALVKVKTGLAAP